MCMKTIKKVSHFVQRERERSISSSLIKKIVKILPKRKGKNAYIISIKTLERCGVKKPLQNLVIVMRGAIAITIYFIENNALFFSQKYKDTHYEIV